MVRVLRGRKPGRKSNPAPTRQTTLTVLEEDYAWVLNNGYNPSQLFHWAVLVKQQYGDKIALKQSATEPWRP